ncbi:hypothetical protein [Bradyrhizobium sp. SEMIA]|uniref:hypothetical protein n=1 Tax=Bradyrhizobium sp. SEMIA TaxID=2597515 RepID=UPI002240E2F4|nr:hypothetical protein [Bradyrhizobium sp. SEMIA]
MTVLDPTKKEGNGKTKDANGNERANRLCILPQLKTIAATPGVPRVRQSPPTIRMMMNMTLCRAHRLYTKITDVIGQIDFREVSLASHALRHIILDQ